MNEAVSRKLRKEVYPKDYSKRGSGYTSTFTETFKEFFRKGKSIGKQKVKMYQVVCTGMRNLYKQKKKEYMLCKKEGKVYIFNPIEVV